MSSYLCSTTLGATLYYMIAGRPPYSGSVAQIVSEHLS